MKNQRSALGRGLASLISSKAVPVNPSHTNAGLVSLDKHPVSGSAAVQSTQSVVRSEMVTQNSHEETPSSVPSSEAASLANANVVPFPSIAGEDARVDGGVRYLPISVLVANPDQPRKEFAERELQELADSIKTLGVLQPILVRRIESKDANGQPLFEIVAGERRFRAAQRAKLEQVPVIIRSLSEREVVEIAVVENVQRADLSPFEEARAYQRLADEFGLTQKEIAERVGKDRATIANFLRLLTLPETILEMLKKGEISMGHAKAIMTVREPAVQINLARKVIAEGLSVRAIEAIVSRSVTLPPLPQKRGEEQKQQPAITPEVMAIIDRLRGRLGTKVSISHHASGKGRIEIEYFSQEELERLIDLIGG